MKEGTIAHAQGNDAASSTPRLVPLPRTVHPALLISALCIVHRAF
jgi:hypothetical protein